MVLASEPFRRFQFNFSTGRMLQRNTMALPSVPSEEVGHRKKADIYCRSGPARRVAVMGNARP